MTKKIAFRSMAKNALKKAQMELESEDDERLKYAALELRMAMEALTYDRMQAYKDEIPESEYKTWQPKKVMSLLLEIDPSADTDTALSIAPEDNNGLSLLKKHYDAIGNFLHTPTIDQLNKNNIKTAKLRERCQTVYNFIDETLLSQVFNVRIGNFAQIACMECRDTIRRKIPEPDKTVIANCYKCKASYQINADANGNVEWKAQRHVFECSNEDCKKTYKFWDRAITCGTTWECECGTTNIFAITSTLPSLLQR